MAAYWEYRAHAPLEQTLGTTKGNLVVVVELNEKYSGSWKQLYAKKKVNVDFVPEMASKQRFEGLQAHKAATKQYEARSEFRFN